MAFGCICFGKIQLNSSVAAIWILVPIIQLIMAFVAGLLRRWSLGKDAHLMGSRFEQYSTRIFVGLTHSARAKDWKDDLATFIACFTTSTSEAVYISQGAALFHSESCEFLSLQVIDFEVIEHNFKVCWIIQSRRKYWIFVKQLKW